MTTDYCVTEHALATADLLELYARKLRQGTQPEAIGREVELLGRIIARRI